MHVCRLIHLIVCNYGKFQEMAQYSNLCCESKPTYSIWPCRVRLWALRIPVPVQHCHMYISYNQTQNIIFWKQHTSAENHHTCQNLKLFLRFCINVKQTHLNPTQPTPLYNLFYKNLIFSATFRMSIEVY